MHIVHVSVHVLPEHLEAFKTATLANATASVREPGILRFDFIQNADDPARFLLIEIYRTPEAQAAHRTTAHYLTWREVVAPMMASPRTAQKFTALFPSSR